GRQEDEPDAADARLAAEEAKGDHGAGLSYEERSDPKALQQDALRQRKVRGAVGHQTDPCQALLRSVPSETPEGGIAADRKADDQKINANECRKAGRADSPLLLQELIDLVLRHTPVHP